MASTVFHLDSEFVVITVLAFSWTTLRALCCVQVGTDVDPLAVKAANDNAALNSVSNKLTALQCSPSVQVCYFWLTSVAGLNQAQQLLCSRIPALSE